MIKAIFSRVMWVGRVAVFCVGLSVSLTVIFGVAATALAAVPGDPFRLGQLNTINKLSRLAGSTSGSLLRIDNNGTGSALQLLVEPGRPPLGVNAAAGKATNLNADRLDGLNSTEFVRPLWANVLQDGTLDDGEGVLSAQKVTSANFPQISYRVTFDRDVSRCAYVATVGHTGPGNPGTGANQVQANGGVSFNEVNVIIADEHSTTLERPFHLVVVC